MDPLELGVAGAERSAALPGGSSDGGGATVTGPQQRAIDHVAAHALARRAPARRTIEQICRMSDVPFGVIDELIGQLQRDACVALHFHPDRVSRDGRTVAEALRDDGVYRTQFETGISNGMLSPERGGRRDQWENELFGDAYVARDLPFSSRPRYGALALMGHADGPSPRFGSSYFVLNPTCSRASTFCFGDSHENPPVRGVWSQWDDVLAALLTESFLQDSALGRSDVRPAGLIEFLCARLGSARPPPSQLSAGRSLDHYIEAQVHGEVLLQRDADLLVVDPSFRETPTEDAIAVLCERYDVRLEWHGGFALPLQDVPTDFRGPRMPALAEQVASAGVVTAASIGIAAAELRHASDRWAAFGAPAEVLQSLKLLWHVLLRYGRYG